MNVRDDVGSKGRHFSFKMDEKVHVSVTKCLIFYALRITRLLMQSVRVLSVNLHRSRVMLRLQWILYFEIHHAMMMQHEFSEITLIY